MLRVPVVATVSNPRLRVRHRVAEVMDDPGLDPALHRDALRGLGRINRVSRSAAAMWPAIEQACREHQAAGHRGRFRVLDLACGGGDTLIQLQQRAARRRLDIEWIGADISPVALGYARRQAQQAGAAVDFIELDVLQQPVPAGVDLAMNSLFMHHLEEQQALAVLAAMRRGATKVLINDLRRGPIAHAVTVLGTRLLSRSPVVHTDGPRSVRAAWTPQELLSLAERAGMSGCTVRPVFPWRMLLSWHRERDDAVGAAASPPGQRRGEP